MAYATYEFYKNEYGGNAIEEADFNGLSIRATAYINAATRGKAMSATGDDLTAVQMATCELAEIFQDENRLNALTFSSTGSISSESVGGWSRSYGTKTLSAADLQLLTARKKSALLIYLQGTGFLQATGYPMAKWGDCW
nr:MAG TPA: Head Tail Connector Protein [Caudoviricetes sp.]